MADLVKLIIIGKGRSVMNQYLFKRKSGELIAKFITLGDFPTFNVSRHEEHHAKLHIHLTSYSDSRPIELARAIIEAHRDLRFVIYYETAQGRGQIEGRHGRILRERRDEY